jgi:nucleophosmin 1
MAFWGAQLKPGQKKPVDLPPGDVLHLSQACLHEPKEGKNVLQVQVKGSTYSIAVLEKQKREHECLDLFFDAAGTTFSVKGGSDIHLIGYVEPSADNFGEDEEEEEEGPGQQAVPQKASPKVASAPSPKAKAAASPKAALAPSPKTSPKAVPQAAAEEDEYEDLEGEGEEEELLPESEEEEEEPQVQQVLPKKSSVKITEVPAQSSAKSPKRKPEAEAPAPPAKKGKTEAKTEAKTDAPGKDEKDAYVKKIIEYLRKNGKTNTGQLGSKLPRPSGVPKLKALLEQNKDKFLVVGDVVTAK